MRAPSLFSSETNRSQFFISVAVLLTAINCVPAQQPDQEMEKQAANTPVNGKTLLEWESDLKDKDPSVREQAMATIKVYGTAARKSAPLIIKALKDPDVGLRVNAVITLGYIGVDEKDLAECVSGLSALLMDQQGIVRFQAARALGRLGRAAYSSWQRLVQRTKDPISWEIRGAAAFALGNVAYDQKNLPERAAINALIDALNDSSSQVRLEALYSLILMGIPGHPQDKSREITSLQNLINGRQPDKVHIWARVAIMRIEKVSEQHLVVIAKYLKSPKVESRIHAARAFATIGPDASTRVQDLVDALSDKDPTMLFWTCAALAQMGDKAQKAIPALQGLVNHPDESVRKQAKDAIDAIQQKRKKES
jgi:HEAT repeat protein